MMESDSSSSTADRLQKSRLETADKFVSPARACVAVTLLQVLPYCVASLFFYGLYRHASASQILSWMGSMPGQLTVECCFAVVLGGVMWSLFTWFAFWLQRLQILLVWSHRALLALLMLPSFVLGPLYFFCLLGMVAFKARRRQLCLRCLPGIVLGYVALMGALTMLSGTLAVSWLNVLLVPGVTLGLTLCSYACILCVEPDCRWNKPVLATLWGGQALWLLVSALLMGQAYRLEKDMKPMAQRLEQAYGKTLTTRALLKEYYHDGQLASPQEHPLQAAVAQGVRRRGDGRYPECLEPEVLKLLETATVSRDALERLWHWEQENRECFQRMDQAAKGAYFKVDVARDGNRYGRRKEIFSNLMTWAQAYHARLFCLAARSSKNAALEGLQMLKHLTWLRNSALDDPFLLANGHCVQLEEVRLKAIQTILGANLLDDSQLRQLDADVKADSARWEARTRRATWSALAWYMAHVQQLDDMTEPEPDRRVPPLNSLLFGYVTPLNFWLLRADGHWLLTFYQQQLGKKTLSLTPDDERQFWNSVPGTATMAVTIALPVRMQFVPLQVKQRALRQAITVRQYELRHGRMPERLENLVPEFMASLPDDPLGTRCFGYRSQLGETPKTSAVKENALPFTAYGIYSVGWDRQDDGGLERLEIKDAKGKVIDVRGDLLVAIGRPEWWTAVRRLWTTLK